MTYPPNDIKIKEESRRFLIAIGEFPKPLRSMNWATDMKKINGRIWDLEADIRNGAHLPLEVVGQRALDIRDINRERIEYKNLIASICGEFQEIKVDHGSSVENMV